MFNYVFLEELVHDIIMTIIPILELMGTMVIIVAGVKAFYRFLLGLIKHTDYPIKVDLAQALALALEFKLGGEILKTVIVRSMDEMYILAAIILLRAILTFVIHWEIKGEKH